MTHVSKIESRQKEIDQLLSQIQSIDRKLQSLSTSSVDVFSSSKGFTYIPGDIQKKQRELFRIRETFTHTIQNVLDSLPAMIALIDHDGIIRLVNNEWKLATGTNCLVPPEAIIGANYLKLCEAQPVQCAGNNVQLSALVRSLVQGDLEQRSREYACNYSSKKRWFRAEAVSMPWENASHHATVLMLIDVTNQKQMEASLIKSEARLKKAQQIAELGWYEWRISDNRLFWSDETYHIFGLTPSAKEIYRDTHDRAVHPEDLPNLSHQVEAFLQNEDSKASFVFRIVRADGDIRWIKATSEKMVTGDGNVTGLTGVLRDVTKDVNHNAALERSIIEQTKSKILFSAILDHSFQWIGLLENNGKILKANKTALNMIGCSQEDVMGLLMWDSPWLKNDTEEDRRKLKSAILRAAKGHMVRYQATTKPAAGRCIQLDVSVSPVENEAGEVIYVIVEGRDITKLQHLHAEVNKKEKHLREILKATPDGILIIQPDTGKILESNPAASQMLGYTYQELLQIDLFDIDTAAAAHKAKAFQRWQRMISEHSTETFISTHRHKHGKEFKVEVRGTALLYREQTCIISAFRDITQRLQSNQIAKIQSLALKSAANSILITDLEGNIEYVNPAFIELSGYSSSEILGKNPRIFKSGKHNAEFYQGMWAQLKAGHVWRGTIVNLKKDGTEYHGETVITPVKDVDGKTTHYIAIKEDITEKIELEEQVHRSQRMETMGLLAGGIAHDLNNLLTPMSLAVDVLRTKPDEAVMNQVLASLESTVTRSASIIRQILTFARGGEGSKEPLQLNLLIKELVKLLNQTLPKSIQIKAELQPDLPTIYGDPTNIHQVLMNMVINARDAMPNGGMLGIESKSTTLHEEKQFLTLKAAPGNYVTVTIRDTGTGIEPSMLPQIFDPFFTTKEVGKGTGLGLSTAFGILKNHEGMVEVHSTLHKGSTFTLYFPAIESNAHGVEQKTNVPQQYKGNGERVLLVDDEEEILDLGAKLLKANGYETQVVHDGIEAIAAVTGAKQPFALVVSDIVMPNMDGIILKRTMSTLDPHLPFVIWSGLIDSESLTPSISELKKLGVTTFLTKPFTSQDLLRAVKMNLRHD